MARRPDHPRRRIEPHRLGDDPLDQRQSRHVGQRRQAALQHAIDLVVESRLDVGCWLSRYHVHVSAFAVVSWPARISVIASSRTCTSDSPPVPPSSSCAARSIDSRSP